MKNKLYFAIVGIILIILLFSLPSNFVSLPESNSSIEYAGVPPVKMPDKIPPKE